MILLRFLLRVLRGKLLVLFFVIYPAGSIVKVMPGQSITMQRYLYHSFWGDGGTAIVGEVSMVNDDTADNRFYKPCGRFADIDEDEAAEYLLCNEYPAAE